MPLVDLLQNLQSFNYYYGGPGNFTQKSIKFGNDTPGGGNSGEPYILWPFPENATERTNDYYRSIRSSLDYPIRGSSVQTLGDAVVIPRSAGYDTQRIQKFIKSSPKGYTFIAKQVGLQLTNPKIEVGEQANLNPGNTSARSFGMLESTRIYNGGLNTLAAVRFAGTGIHPDRHGLTPFNPQSQTYARVVQSYNQANNGVGNRLVVLLKNKIQDQVSTRKVDVNTGEDGNSGANRQYFANLDSLNRLGIPRRNENVFFQYPGGPGSTYGIGVTIINRYENNNFLYGQSIVSPLYRINGSEISLVPAKDIIANTSDERKTTSGYVRGTELLNADAATVLGTNRLLVLRNNLFFGGQKQPIFLGAAESTKFYNTLPNSPGFVYQYNINNQTGDTTSVKVNRSVNTQENTDTLSDLGNNYTPNNGAKTFNYTLLNNQALSPDKGKSARVRRDFRKTINESKPAGTPLIQSDYEDVTLLRRGDSTKPDGVNLLDVGQDYGTFGSESDDLIKFKFESIEYDGRALTPIIFRAFLTSLSDAHTGEWSPFRYVGRGENFYSYQGFTRGLTFGFRIAAQSELEMKPLYRKLNFLASQVYPDYNDSGFMRSPLMNITIGDYIVQQPGFLANVSITVPTESPWDIADNYGAQVTRYQLPQVLDISCQFTPIHDFLPRRSHGMTLVKLENNAAGQAPANTASTQITPLITPNDAKNLYDIKGVS